MQSNCYSRGIGGRWKRPAFRSQGAARDSPQDTTRLMCDPSPRPFRNLQCRERCTHIPSYRQRAMITSTNNALTLRCLSKTLQGGSRHTYNLPVLLTPPQTTIRARAPKYETSACIRAQGHPFHVCTTQLLRKTAFPHPRRTTAHDDGRLLGLHVPLQHRWWRLWVL